MVYFLKDLFFFFFFYNLESYPIYNVLIYFRDDAVIMSSVNTLMASSFCLKEASLFCFVFFYLFYFFFWGEEMEASIKDCGVSRQIFNVKSKKKKKFSFFKYTCKL